MTAATLTAVHPKILERREAVEGAHMQSRNRRLAGLLAFIMFAAMVWSALHSSLFDVDEVRVIGTSTELADDIRVASEIAMGDALLRLKTDAAEARLLELPGVVDVSVSRAWTGVVTVDVVQRFAVAEVHTPNGVAEVGDDGVVISVSPVRVQAIAGAAIVDSVLPTVTGVVFSPTAGEQVPEQLTDAVAVAAGLPEDLASTIDTINVAERGVSLNMVGGATTFVGDGRELETKFSAMRAFLSQVDLRCLQEIDLQSPLVPVVRRAAC